MKGLIYKLIDNTNGNIYYGSTIQKIYKRISDHKKKYKRYLQGNFNYTTSFDIIKNNNYNVEIVEEVECETKFELHNRERYYIENNICVNKRIPNRTMKEYGKVWYEDNKEKRRDRYEKNKEYLKEKVSCECGAIVSRVCLSIHKKSKKHLNKTIQDT